MDFAMPSTWMTAYRASVSQGQNGDPECTYRLIALRHEAGGKHWVSMMCN